MIASGIQPLFVIMVIFDQIKNPVKKIRNVNDIIKNPLENLTGKERGTSPATIHFQKNLHNF